MATLSAQKRKSLPKSAFVFPNKAPGSGSYPIHDLAHARAALRLGGAHASPAEYAAIKRKVYARYPELRPKDKK